MTTAVDTSLVPGHMEERLYASIGDDHDPIIITRNSEQSVVLLSLDDYQALEETAFLLGSPINATRLLASIHELNSGKGQLQELDL